MVDPPPRDGVLAPSEARHLPPRPAAGCSTLLRPQDDQRKGPESSWSKLVMKIYPDLVQNRIRACSRAGSWSGAEHTGQLHATQKSRGIALIVAMGNLDPCWCSPIELVDRTSIGIGSQLGLSRRSSNTRARSIGDSNT